MNMGKPTEGLELAKLGCKNNIKSGFCWHILGLVYKSMHNYDEAVKSFRSSLRNDKDNVTVLKDLANCSIQIEDFSLNMDLRRQIIFQRPSSYSHWFALWTSCAQSEDSSLDKLSITINSLLDIQNDSYYSEYRASIPSDAVESNLVLCGTHSKKPSVDAGYFFTLYVRSYYFICTRKMASTKRHVKFWPKTLKVWIGSVLAYMSKCLFDWVDSKLSSVYCRIYYQYLLLNFIFSPASRTKLQIHSKNCSICGYISNAHDFIIDHVI